MSVAIAITVTLPNATAAGIVATGAEITQTLGNEVIRIISHQVVDGKNVNVAGATASTVVT